MYVHIYIYIYRFYLYVLYIYIYHTYILIETYIHIYPEPPGTNNHGSDYPIHQPDGFHPGFTKFSEFDCQIGNLATQPTCPKLYIYV